MSAVRNLPDDIMVNQPGQTNCSGQVLTFQVGGVQFEWRYIPKREFHCLAALEVARVLSG